MADYNRAIESDPDYAIAYLNRADIYYTLKNYPKAVKDATTAVDLNPYLAYAWNLRGWSLQGERQYDLAAQNFTVALTSIRAMPVSTSTGAMP